MQYLKENLLSTLLNNGRKGVSAVDVGEVLLSGMVMRKKLNLKTSVLAGIR